MAARLAALHSQRLLSNTNSQVGDYDEVAASLAALERRMAPSVGGASSRMPRDLSDGIAALHSQRLLSNTNGHVGDYDEVATSLAALERRMAPAIGGASSRMPRDLSDEMAARLAARHSQRLLSNTNGQVVADEEEDDRKIAAGLEALQRRVARSGRGNGADAYTRSNFGLSLTEIESILKRNK